MMNYINLKNKNINLSIVRIIAAFMVLSVHIGQYTGFNFSVGAKGVQLFFILSGYLAFVSLNNNSSTKVYYKNRILKILPIYWICLIIIYLKDMIVGLCNSTFIETLRGQCSPKFLRYFVFLQCFTPTENWNLWNNHSALWTMSSFAGFYLVAPLLFNIMKKFYRSFTILIISMLGTPHLVSWIQHLLSKYPEEAHIELFSSMNPLVVLYCFLLGCVLFVAIKENKQNVYTFTIVIALLTTSISWYQYELLFVLFLMLAIFLAPITDNKMIVYIISLLSDGSFALYLLHPILLWLASLTWKVIGVNNNKLYAIFLYIFSVCIAYVIYHYFIRKVEYLVTKKFVS